MSWPEFVDQLGSRLASSLHPVAPQLGDRLIWVLVVAAVVVFGPSWRWVRPVVTVIHELGHAAVGVACGRRFRGFVVSPDMSGHAVTKGRARGPGMVLTLAAGYPMPGFIGAVLIWAAIDGYAALLLLAMIIVLSIALVKSRSLFTAAIVIALWAVVVVMWWRGNEAWNGILVSGLGLIVLLGAWRHLFAVAASRDPKQDPAALAKLTRLPAAFWTLIFAVLIGACSWWAGHLLYDALTQTGR